MIIRQAIFILGCGRSGTTLLYYLLAGHKDLAWFSNYTDKFPNQPWLSILNHLFKIPTISKHFRENQLFPFIIPSEGYNLWNLFHPIGPRARAGAARPLFESDIKDTNIDLMKKTILKHLKYSKCNRFINKNTRNTRRSRYLFKIFPDALFIHVIRDGRAVTNSLLNVGFWNNLHLWYRDDFKTPAQLIQEGENEVLLAAKLWKFEVHKMLLDSNKIPKGQYLEVRYENLTKEPISILKNILLFCNLDYSKNFEKHIKSFNIINRNYKWKKNLSKNQIQIVEKELNNLLKVLGYKT